MEKIFRPFIRIEGSRNFQTEGFGLCLTVSQNIARHFCCDVKLKNLSNDGFRAELRIPLAETVQSSSAK